MDQSLSKEASIKLRSYTKFLCKYIFGGQCPFIGFSIWGMNNCSVGLELKVEDVITVFISSMSQEDFG